MFYRLQLVLRLLWLVRAENTTQHGSVRLQNNTKPQPTVAKILPQQLNALTQLILLAINSSIIIFKRCIIIMSTFILLRLSIG